MALIPHAGELALIFGVILLIVILGRLPQLSYLLAGAGKHAGSGSASGSSATDSASAEPDESVAASEDEA